MTNVREPSEPMSSKGISLASSREAFEVGAAAQRLNLLDDLWTSYAENSAQAGGSFEDNSDTLAILVGDMQAGLADMRSRVVDLHGLALELGAEAITHAVDELTAEVPNRDHVRAALGLDDRSDPVFANALTAACKYVYAEAQAESEELQTKLDILIPSRFQAIDLTEDEDTLSLGDFKIGFKCALTIVGAGGLVLSGAIMGALTGVAIGALALGTATGALGGASTGLIAVAASPCLDKAPKLA
jgi:hypothetical protein